MEERRPHAGDGATRGRIEQHVPSPKLANSQPQVRPFRVVVTRDIWRRYVVSTYPATITHQPRSFPDYGAAMAYAEEMARLERWPLIDRAGEE